MWVCLCVLYSNPNGCTDWDEIWHRGGPWGGRLLGGGVNQVPPPTRVRGASGVSTVRFGENFIKQKLQGTPDLVGAGHFLGPKSGSGRTWAPCLSGAMFTHYEGEFIKSKLHHMFLLCIWWGWTPPTLPPGSRGHKSWSGWGSWASGVHFGGNFIKQKLLGTPNLVGVGHLIGPKSFHFANMIYILM